MRATETRIRAPTRSGKGTTGSRSCGASRDRPRDSGARRAERRRTPCSASRSSGRSEGCRAGPTCCGSPASAISSVSPRSGSSGRSSSSSACRSAAGGSCSRSCAAPPPRAPPASPRPAAPARLRRPGRRHASSAALLVTAAGVALTGLLLEALFRSARLQSLQAYDAWAFWVPKAKAIYFFGGLDQQVFTTFPGPTYPPLVPILDAAAFHAMGGADVVTFHLQYWFLVVGAVAAIAGCLYRHVPAWFLWPPLVLVLAVPRVASGLLTPQADMLVDALFVVGALLLALWLRDGRGWRLAAAAVLFAGAGLTKREGLLFVAAALVVALVASLGRRGEAGPASSRSRRSSARPRCRGGSGTGATASAARRPPTSAREARSAGWRLAAALVRRVLRHDPVVGRADRRADRGRRSARLGRPARGRFPRGAARARLPRRRLGYVLLSRRPDHRGRGAEPDRPLHRGDRAPRGGGDAVAARLGVARAERRAAHEALDRAARRGGDRRRAARRLPGRGARRRCSLPLRRGLRPHRRAGRDGRPRPRVRPSRHAGGGGRAPRAGQARRLSSTPRSRGTAACVGRSSTPGSSRTRRAPARQPRRAAPASGPKSRSRRPGKNSLQSEALCRRVALGGALRRPRSPRYARISGLPASLHRTRPSRPVGEASLCNEF